MRSSMTRSSGGLSPGKSISGRVRSSSRLPNDMGLLVGGRRRLFGRDWVCRVQYIDHKDERFVCELVAFRFTVGQFWWDGHDHLGANLLAFETFLPSGDELLKFKLSWCSRVIWSP